MIVEIMIKLGIFFIQMFDRLLPNWSIPDFYINAFATGAVNALKWADIVPLRAMINVIIIMIAYHLIFFTFKFITGLLSLIRGGGGVDI